MKLVQNIHGTKHDTRRHSRRNRNPKKCQSILNRSAAEKANTTANHLNPSRGQQKVGRKLQRSVGKYATKVKDVPDLGQTPDQRARNVGRRSKMQSNAPEPNGLHKPKEEKLRA